MNTFISPPPPSCAGESEKVKVTMEKVIALIMQGDLVKKVCMGSRKEEERKHKKRKAYFQSINVLKSGVEGIGYNMNSFSTIFSIMYRMSFGQVVQYPVVVNLKKRRMLKCKKKTSKRISRKGKICNAIYVMLHI